MALLLFAILVFALMGIAALVADVGSAFLAQGQMQNAVDSAAVEGVRMRDYFHYLHPSYSNYARRQRAAQMVRFTFDDDLHPTQGSHFGIDDFAADSDEDQLHLTVGPSIALVGGDSQDNIGASIVEGGNDYLDDPILESNVLWNLTSGDMVSGTYSPNAAHIESEIYERADFHPGDPADGTDWQALGFLVRMRRTSQPNDLDRVSGVSSAGPGVPFLFGQGTPIHADPDSNYNPRTMGTTVRATGIAAAAPALAVSYSPCRDASLVPDPLLQATDGLTVPFMGFYGIAFRKDFWEATTDRTLSDWNPDVSSGLYRLRLDEITGDLTLSPSTSPPQWVSQFVGEVVGSLVHDGRSIGQRLVPVSLDEFQHGTVHGDQEDAECRWNALVVNSGDLGFFERGYVAIHTPIAEASGLNERRIIGYGFCKLTYVPDPGGGGPYEFGFTPGLPSPFDQVECWVGQHCASAHLSGDVEALDSTAWQHVFDELYDLVYDIPTTPAQRYEVAHIRHGTLLAPTLVR